MAYQQSTNIKMQAKAMQSGDAKGNGTGGGGLSGGNFGPKYEQHVSEMQRQLDEANKKYTPLLVIPPSCIVKAVWSCALQKLVAARVHSQMQALMQAFHPVVCPTKQGCAYGCKWAIIAAEASIKLWEASLGC